MCWILYFLSNIILLDKILAAPRYMCIYQGRSVLMIIVGGHLCGILEWLQESLQWSRAGIILP